MLGLTREFYRLCEAQALVEPAVRSAADRLRVWGVPWNLNLSALFYR